MESPFEALTEVLEKEAARYSTLSVLAEEQKAILVAGNLAALPVNVKAQEREMFALGPLTDRRQKAYEAGALQLRLSKPTLTEVVAKCPAPWAEVLRAAAGSAIEAAKKLEASNRGNEKLIANALAYVNFSLEAMGGKGKGLPASLRPTVSNAPPEKRGPGRFNQVV